MRQTIKMLVGVAAITMAAGIQQANSAFFGLPKTLGLHLSHLQLQAPALAPFAYSLFCMRYPQDCEVRRMAFRPHPYTLTPPRWNDLIEVNAKVNHEIIPQAMDEAAAQEKWLVAPKFGDCNDYAVTKRHELLARGWPSRTLLLAEVVIPSGEHHLVLVARTKDGDFVLDNLRHSIQPWSAARYQWVRMQSGGNPHLWATVANTTAT